MISILVPIYNGIEFIEESIGSVLHQTFTDWEVIIGVNGHPENSPVYQIAKEYEKKSNKIRVFDFHTIKGKSETLNEMLKYCNYDYVALLDVDDAWLPEKLMVQSKYMGDYDVIGTQCVYFGEKDNSPFVPLGDISKYDFFSVNPVINSSSVIRKSLCFWEDKFNLEDYNLWLTLRKQNKKFYNCHEVLVKHRIHSSSYFNAQGNNLKVEELLNIHINTLN
jgi:glycosyltransferase involved in cell wall biosynthesis